MEDLDGETVAQRLEQGALPLDQALQIAIEMTEAVDAAHRREFATAKQGYGLCFRRSFTPSPIAEEWRSPANRKETLWPQARKTRPSRSV